MGDGPFNVSVNAATVSCDNGFASGLRYVTSAAEKLYCVDVCDHVAFSSHTPTLFMQVSINVDGFALERCAEVFHMACGVRSLTSPIGRNTCCEMISVH